MMKKLLLILAILAISMFAFSACANDDNGNAVEKNYDIAKIDGSVLEANQQFAFDIFQQLNSEDKNSNIFISPLSISTALTMTYNGAASSTEQAMAETLSLSGLSQDIINTSYANLLPYLQNIDKDITLDISNSIWIRQGREINPDFVAINQKDFWAEVMEIDFSKDTAADTINQWIAEATEQKITKMISAPIDADVVMYIINALYFKGQWSEAFKSENTFDKVFTTYEGQEQTVDMMLKNEAGEYGAGSDYQAVRLPYGNGHTAMYCILPLEGLDINDFISNLDAEKWQTIKNSILGKDTVNLQIPRFKLDYGIKNLNDSLTALGMGEAFGEQADFSGITDNINISKVLHKAVIEVNESGSEAAAATVVEMKETALPIEEAPPTFIADRPFLFLIVDDSTNSILFMGKVLNI